MFENWQPHKPETWTYHYARLVKDTLFYDYNPITRETTNRTVPAGTVVRIVMVSRFGDLGITDNLEKEMGYDARVRPSDLTEFHNR